MAWRPVIAALFLLPLAGCVNDAGPVARIGLFSFDLIERGDPTPVHVDGCPDLLERLNAKALDQSRVFLEQGVEGQGHIAIPLRLGGGVQAMEDTAAPAVAGGTAQHARGAQVTGTNNQEAGADEADIVKTDGEWTYVLSQGVLHILHSENIGDVEEVARMELGYSWGASLVLERRDPNDPADDRLLVVLPGQYPEEQTIRILGDERAPRAMGGMTRILVLSLADRGDPAFEDEVVVEGNAVGARLVDGTAYVVVHRWEQDLALQTWAEPDEETLRGLGLTWEGFYALPAGAQRAIREDVARAADAKNQRILDEAELEDHLPIVLRSRFGFLLPEAVTDEVCDRVLVTPGSTGRGFSTILAFGLGGDTVTSATTQVMGGSPIVYASEDALVLAAPSQDFWWFWVQPGLEEATDLQWFDLDGLDVRPRAAGRVAGIVQDSFGIDVHGDELRVATTTGTWGRWWLPEPTPMMNHVAVFQEAAGVLVPHGLVGGIAPGERIWSARFTDDRAYLVTFRQMDPLWVIDLSGSRPRVLGELEIPGVSTYIHPLDDDTLLTIGLGPGPDGEGLDWGRVQVSLFDISDVSEPRRADVLDLSPGSDGGSWSFSGAVDEHKAFTYWEAVDTLAVPLSTSRGYETVRGGALTYVQENHVGLRLVTVDRDAMDLRLRGEVDQDHLLPDEGGYGGEVQRSYFLGHPDGGPVSVYAVSDLGVTAHDLATLREQGSVSFLA